MNIKDYIASGVLEQYVLDQLSPAERREVEQHALEYPAIKEELNAIEETLFAFASAAARKPRAGLEQEIVNHVIDNGNRGITGSSTASKINWWPIILGALGLIAAGIFGWMYTTAKNDIQQAEAEHRVYIQDCEEKEGQLIQLQNMVDQLLKDGSQMIQMKGTEAQPNAYANVIYNINEKSTYLETANLPVPVSGRQYQLWAIVAGAPVDLGVFDISTNIDLLQMKFVENAQAFAVTLEPTGGSVNPTMDQMYVIANRPS